MAIKLSGRTYRTASDKIVVNGKTVREAYCNGVKVYPEEELASYVIKWRSSGGVDARVRDVGRYSRSYVAGTIEYDMVASMSFTPVHRTLGNDYDSVYGLVCTDTDGRFVYVDSYDGMRFIALNTYRALISVRIAYGQTGYPVHNYKDRDLPSVWKLSSGGPYKTSFSYSSDKLKDGVPAIVGWDILGHPSYYASSIEIDSDVFWGAHVNMDTAPTFPTRSANRGFAFNFAMCDFVEYPSGHVELDDLLIPHPDVSGVIYKNFNFSANSNMQSVITDPNPPSSAYYVSPSEL